MYKKRLLEAKVMRFSHNFKTILLSGARQDGLGSVELLKKNWGH